jgi:nucleoredoxin
MTSFLRRAGLAVLIACGAAAFSSLQPAGAADGTTFTSKFDKHLVVLDSSGKFAPFDASTLNGKKYIALYFSASWCPPCRKFTPTLVDFYKDFKTKHPNFELILVNHDQSADDMLAYMKGDNMIWPAVKYEDIEGLNLDSYDSQGGIPDLILFDANGKVLSDSFQGSEYVGPDKVLGDIKTMVQ